MQSSQVHVKDSLQLYDIIYLFHIQSSFFELFRFIKKNLFASPKTTDLFNLSPEKFLEKES